MDIFCYNFKDRLLAKFAEPWDLEDNSYTMEEIVTYVRESYLMQEASTYSNKAITEYLHRGYEFDGMLEVGEFREARGA